ncbi:MAG: exodeoxyribonuclease III [Gammaproteobacteria bacterium RIFCSPHIGHO2_02_FULL_39_13]|nr:MAG: exodeoxyribonuclease III [Gammaproteobacteria bacterium RIFCSPHIGHO2_02_FULL_39_13]OGT48748.1 MAG: exodeoxyribonuclease III [Gammaproteobacteria bacterium RIFCSPHIGHO2_12_FULL_39_24]
MRIITANVNGIRSAAKKGFFTWLSKQKADVICLQETKAQTADLADELYRPTGYHCYFSDAEKKGYSGVALYAKQKPDQVLHTLGWKCADNEGRFVRADFNNLTVISLYLPSGSSGEHRQVEKFDFMEKFLKILREFKKSKREFIICGDWNIVHKEIDIKNFKSNQKTSGCLPEERAWLDNVLTHEGFVDAFRVINHEKDQYTWWSNRGEAYAKNVGWRIDYQIISESLKSRVKSVSIYRDEKFSDHAPVVVDYLP